MENMTQQVAYPRNCDVTSLIVELVKLYKPRVYLEIGTQKGYTFTRVAPLVEEAHAVDVKIQKAVRRVPNATVHECDSDTFFKAMPEGDWFDMVFIDGDHAMEQVLRDAYNALDVVRPGTGLVLIHDTYPITPELAVEGRCGNAWKAARHLWLTDGGYECLTLPGPAYGVTILRKCSGHFGNSDLDREYGGEE